VDRLVREGLIRREENPEDRRQKQLTLTPEGAALSGEMETVFTDRLRPLLGVLDPAEQEQLRWLLARMLAAHLTLANEEHGEPHPPHCPRRGMPRAVRGEAEEN
jgi:DNA-binding PadR family transcriptional regulator